MSELHWKQLRFRRCCCFPPPLPPGGAPLLKLRPAVAGRRWIGSRCKSKSGDAPLSWPASSTQLRHGAGGRARASAATSTACGVPIRGLATAAPRASRHLVADAFARSGEPGEALCCRRSVPRSANVQSGRAPGSPSEASGGAPVLCFLTQQLSPWSGQTRPHPWGFRLHAQLPGCGPVRHAEQLAG